MKPESYSNPKTGYRLALFGAFLAAFVVMLGAFTRLVDAGLGCPDWPGCFGHLLWPDDAEEIARAGELFPGIEVESDKTWPEMVHRYFAGSLMLVNLALAVLAVRNRRDSEYPFRMPMLMLVLVFWQALFGMWTVTLKLWPQVVTVHLLGGITTFTLLCIYALRLQNSRWQESLRTVRKLKKRTMPIAVGAILVFFQIALGGWVAANYAAFGCPELPTCRGEWWPAMDFVAGFNFMQDVGPNYLGGLLDNEARAAIHMAHRIGALVVLVYLFGLGIKVYRAGSKNANRVVYLIWVLLFAQLSLGISNILFILPLPVAVAHNFFGALLLISICVLLLRAMTAREASTSA